MKKVIILCTFLIVLTIQWAIHSYEGKIDFFWDILPMIIIGVLIGGKYDDKDSKK